VLAACGGGSGGGGELPGRDKIAPVVQVTSPKSGEIVASSNLNLIIKFNENIKKPETTNIDIFPYKPDGSLDRNRRVPLKAGNELSVNNDELIIRPVSNISTDNKALVSGTKYHVHVRGIQDTTGNPMGDCRWEFAIANYDLNKISANPKPCATPEPATKAGQFEFASPSNDVPEIIGSYSILVKRTNGSDGSVVVSYQVNPGTATAGIDYTDTTGTLIFQDGVLEQSIVILILDQPNLKDQLVKTFTVTLKQASNGGTVNQLSSLHTIGIKEANYTNAQAGIFSFRLIASDADERITTHIVDVVRDFGVTSTVTVTITVADISTNNGAIDYTIPTSSLTLTFLPNSFKQTIAITIVNDSLVENPNEQFELTIATVASNDVGLSPQIDTVKNTHKVTIISDDVFQRGLIDFVITSPTSVAEDSPSINPNKITIDVRRFNGLDGIVSVDPSLIFGAANTLGLADISDIVTITPTTLTFQDQDSTVQQVVVSIFDDSKEEPAETFKIGLSTPTGGASLPKTFQPYEVTILASDPIVIQPGTIAFGTELYSISEATSTTLIPVIRTGDTSVAQTITYSASSLGSDTAVLGINYQQPVVGTLTFPAASTQIQYAEVPINNDNTLTGNLTFTVTLSSSTLGTIGSPSIKSVTINDVGVSRVLTTAELVAIWSLLL